MEKQENTPDILLYMPEPERLVAAISSIGKEQKLIESFCKLVEYDDVDIIINKMDQHISMLMNQLSDDPTIISCYKTEQQRMSDEYFFIQRTNTDTEKRFILNTFVIARDILVNNKIDNYLGNEQIKLSLDVMGKLLSYASSRGELNGCE